MADVVAWVLSLDTLDDKESVAERIRQEGVDGASLPLFAQSADFRLLKQDLQISTGNAAKLWAALRDLQENGAPLTIVGGAPQEGVPPPQDSQHPPTPLRLDEMTMAQIKNAVSALQLQLQQSQQAHHAATARTEEVEAAAAADLEEWTLKLQGQLEVEMRKLGEKEVEVEWLGEVGRID